MTSSPDRSATAVSGNCRFRLSLLVIALALITPLRGEYPVCRAQAGGDSPFAVQFEMGYERGALNYKLLLADTSSLSPDSLEHLRQAADIRTEPLAGLRLGVHTAGVHLDNGLRYTKSGWREDFDGRVLLHPFPGGTMRATSRFDYYGATAAEDTLLVDYWSLANEVRLLTRISSSHALLMRIDWNRLHYPGTPPSFGYNFDRLRARGGWSWQSADFDFVEFTAGLGERLAPDSTDREYDERFAEGYGDFTVADDHRLSFVAAVQARDYRSGDPGDDYTSIYLESRYDWAVRPGNRLALGVRWDFWNFGAQDEVSFDFYEFHPTLEYILTLTDAWRILIGPSYRSAAAVDTAYALADYHQPSGTFGAEYVPDFPVWIDARFELGRRNYAASSSGYSDYTMVQFDTSADIDLGHGLTCSAGIDYEIEFHDEETDDTDFLFFSLNVRYRLIP